MKTGFYENNYKSTGNMSVDMVLSAVAHYRKANRPLKTIYLSRYHYDRFDDYFKSIGAKKDDISGYQFDGIAIERSNETIGFNQFGSSDGISFEFWPTKRTDSLDEIYLKK